VMLGDPVRYMSMPSPPFHLHPRFHKPNRELGSYELLYSLWCTSTTSDAMTEQNISDRSRCILVRGKTNVYMNFAVDNISDVLAHITGG